jgi:predicted small lipoprotein YifL
MKIKKVFYLIFILLFGVSACGKKGPLESLPDQKRPKFDKVIDEKD